MEQNKQAARSEMRKKLLDTVLGCKAQHKPLSEMTAEEKLARAQKMADRVNAQEGRLTGYDCPACRNKGFVEYVKDTTEQLGYPSYTTGSRECVCMAIRRSKWLLKKSGLADLAERCTFDTYKATEPWQVYIRDRAEGFLEKAMSGSGRGFFIGGQTGCGKTHICTALTVSLINSGKSARYMLWTDEAARLKACVNDDQYASLMWPLKAVGVLYIDDLFKPTGASGQPTQADIRLAYELINYRYNSTNKVTIISSERTTGELCEIDEAIGGRIVEKSGQYCINIARDRAKNWRLNHANA